MTNKIFCCFVILFSIFFISQNANAQNLISNPSFEHHKAINAYNFLYRRDELDLLGWAKPSTEFIGLYYLVLDENYKLTDSQKHDTNIKKDYKAQDGHSMVALGYRSECSCMSYTSDEDLKGCSSYIEQKLKEPLKIGEVYKISFWVYIPKIYSFPVDSNAIKSIGCTTSYNSLTSLGCLKEISPLSKNKLLSFDGWHYLSWIIRPTCIQRYLNIGVFKPSLWGTENFQSGQKNNYAQLIYFIDNVSIEPYTGNTNSDNAISYCNYSQNSSYSFMNSTFKSRFNSGDSIPLSYSSLDSLVTQAIQNPKEAYFIAGHTDNEGGNHLKLSKQRVNQVLTYLKSKGVSPFRFVKAYMGASNPEHENKTEAGKALNRQVVISNLDKNGYSVAMYRNALECFKNNNLQDAFKFLNLWEANCESKYKTPTIFDPAIKKYQKDVRYKKIYNKIITNHYKRFKLPKLAYELDSLYFEDQSARELPLYLEELSGVWTGTDTIQRSFPSMDVITDSLRSEALILKIKNIINKHGLPKFSEVGKRAAKSSLVILAHAYKHHADYIENLLPSIKDLCTIGEIDWDYYAIIYDKWCILKNKPQHYGTQYRLVNGKEQIIECDATIEEINKRRYVMGLFELTN